VPVFLTDTHAHLADPALLPDVSDVVATAAIEGVDHILAVGTDLPSSVQTVDLAERFPTVWAAVGIHPHEASSCSGATLQELRTLAEHPKVVAIGEIGLDYFRNLSPAAVQQTAFAEQLALAASLGLPAVVHNRDASADVLRFIGGVARDPDLAMRAGVLHCFSADVETAREAIRLGFFMSFAGNLTYQRADDLRAVAATLPGEWVLTETDSPYLAPVPLRGQVNQPANVRLVVERLADVRGIPVEVAAAETSANARRLFRWP
jgi:TatD DNase family protein